MGLVHDLEVVNFQERKKELQDHYSSHYNNNPEVLSSSLENLQLQDHAQGLEIIYTLRSFFINSFDLFLSWRKRADAARDLILRPCFLGVSWRLSRISLPYCSTSIRYLVSSVKKFFLKFLDLINNLLI